MSGIIKMLRLPILIVFLLSIFMVMPSYAEEGPIYCPKPTEITLSPKYEITQFTFGAAHSPWGDVAIEYPPKDWEGDHLNQDFEIMAVNPSLEPTVAECAYNIKKGPWMGVVAFTLKTTIPANYHLYSTKVGDVPLRNCWDLPNDTCYFFSKFIPEKGQA